MLFTPTGKVVRVPGMPPMYDHEMHPQIVSDLCHSLATGRTHTDCLLPPIPPASHPRGDVFRLPTGLRVRTLAQRLLTGYSAPVQDIRG